MAEISLEMSQKLAEEIEQFAKQIGFDQVGFTKADQIKHAASDLKEFVAQGLYGEMAWMEDTLERRSAPDHLWSDVQSVIMLGMNYGPHNNPLDGLKEKDKGLISVYAKGHDYHDLIKKKLKQLARFMVTDLAKKHGIDETVEVKVFVDTAPVMEKPLAGAAGLGWQGKHTNLVSKEYGSWLFLGSIYTTLKLPQSDQLKDHCGSCSDCLKICPTDAFIDVRKIDARKCISYLTIEYGGHIDRTLRSKMGNHIYGCDDCLAICPWNKFSQISSEAKFHARVELYSPELADLVQLNEQEFRQIFTASPIKRIKRRRFIRNVLIAIGNSGNKAYIEQIKALLLDEEPLIRGACIWALEQLMEPDEFKALAEQYQSGEQDEAVQKEWQQSIEAVS